MSNKTPPLSISYQGRTSPPRFCYILIEREKNVMILVGLNLGYRIDSTSLISTIGIGLRALFFEIMELLVYWLGLLKQTPHYVVESQKDNL